MIFLLLPYPPSVNSYWGFKGHKRFLTKKAVDFKNEVAYRFLLSKYVGYGGIPLHLKVALHPPDNRVRDIDNCLKSLLDAMCQAGMFTDDCQIQKLEIEKSKPVKGGLCSIWLKPYEKN